VELHAGPRGSAGRDGGGAADGRDPPALGVFGRAEGCAPPYPKGWLGPRAADVDAALGRLAVECADAVGAAGEGRRIVV